MMTDFRVGQGFDVHRLVEERKLILCGVEIPYEKGLLGHSDADVAIHALIDALLGALALGDIGELFPDNDAQWKGADSTELLKKVLALPAFQEWRISNLDITIIAQKPKLAPYKKAMQQRMAQVMALEEDRIAIKATTTEKLGYTGRGEGIAATAIAALVK
jgi:2-C-methyl-D-erythritol 2,4-cyclodiphosphate synthase